MRLFPLAKAQLHSGGASIVRHFSGRWASPRIGSGLVMAGLLLVVACQQDVADAPAVATRVIVDDTGQEIVVTRLVRQTIYESSPD